MTKVLVIIVTYNAMNWVERCFDSLHKSTVSVDIFVVDNGSTDGTQDFISKNYSNVILVKNTYNEGFGKANNIGFKYALTHNYDYIYLLNQDAWVFPDTIFRLITAYENNVDYGLLSPFQMQSSLESLDDNFLKNICRKECAGKLINDYSCNKVAEVYDVPFVMAAHWFLKIDTLRKIGGFSHAFPHYGEDNNYISRLRYHNMKIGIVPSSIAVHDRKNRIIDNKKLYYYNYIGYIVIISDPLYSIGDIVLRLGYKFIVDSIKLKSLMPLWNLFKVLGCYPKLFKLKKSSLSFGAFLN